LEWGGIRDMDGLAAVKKQPTGGEFQGKGSA